MADAKRKGGRAVLGRDPFSSLTGPDPGTSPEEPEAKSAPEAPPEPAPPPRPKARRKAKPRPKAKKASAPRTGGTRKSASAERTPPTPPRPDPFERLERRLEQALRDEPAPGPAVVDAEAVAPLVEAVGRALDGVENLGDRVAVLEERIDGFLAEAEERLATLSADGNLSPAARDEVRTLGGWVRTLKELRSALDGAKLRRAWQSRGSRARVTGALVLEELRHALRRGR